MDEEDLTVEITENGSLLDFFLAVMRNPKQPYRRREKCAIAAAPFCHPKLAVHAQITTEDLADRLLRAMQASARVINSRPAMQMIEPPKAEAGLPTDAGLPDHSKPFPVDNKSRFKRL